MLVAATGRQWPQTPRAWAQLAGYGLLANAGYLGLTYEALRHLSAGMGAIIASTNPLLLALVAPALLGESLSFRKVLGLLLGFAGVLAAMAARVSAAVALEWPTEMRTPLAAAWAAKAAAPGSSGASVIR